MLHLLFLYRVLMHTFGFSILVFAAYKYAKTKHAIIKAFLPLWISMTLTAALYSVDFYTKSFALNHVVSAIYYCKNISYVLIAVSLIHFTHAVFNMNNKAIYFIVSSISGVSVLCFIFINKQFFYPVIMAAIILSNIYFFTIVITRLFSSEYRVFRKSGVILLFFYILNFILLYIFDIAEKFPQSGFLFYPIFYMWIGLCCLYLSTMLKNEPIKIMSEKFITRYNFTDRETEVTQLLIQGHTYKSIGDKLCISINTVSSHIKNIYRKSDTKNKMQLNNLIEQFQRDTN